MSAKRARLSALFASFALLLAMAAPRLAHATPGDIDPTFGHHGDVLLSFGQHYAQGSAIAIDERGRIVLAGTTGTDINNATSVAVARLRPGGKLDRSFSKDGMATWTSAHRSRSQAWLWIPREGSWWVARPVAA